MGHQTQDADLIGLCSQGANRVVVDRGNHTAQQPYPSRKALVVNAVGGLAAPWGFEISGCHMLYVQQRLLRSQGENQQALANFGGRVSFLPPTTT